MNEVDGTTMKNKKSDRLYDLLPMVYRMRDQEAGQPLRALLQVIAEQVNIVEDDISQLYDNWFIETCEDWVVPYIGDLVGYRHLPMVESLNSLSALPMLVPRRDVADTIHNRRRKGTIALLEEIAMDIAGWPSRAVEFYKLLGWTQHVNHIRSTSGKTADLHNSDALTQIGSPFDSIAHTIDVRRISSKKSPGRFNIPGVGLFIWRLKTYTITKAPACCIENKSPNCYSFSVLGNDVQLFTKPEPETNPSHIAEENNLPVPIRRWVFDKQKDKFYGDGKSFQIWVQGWNGYKSTQPLPESVIIPADLSEWSYRPPLNRVAIDPVHGRIVFPPSQLPRGGVRVTYRYAFSADIGGGEYVRTVSQDAEHKFVSVGENEEVKHVHDAWNSIQREWKANPDKPQNGIIEITDSGVYVEHLHINLKEGQSLQIRAMNGCRPVFRLIDWQTDMPDSLRISMSQKSVLTLDGLMIAGRPVSIRANECPALHDEMPQNSAQCNEHCPPMVNIRHCTLVPGWSLESDCKPRRNAEPCLEFYNVQPRVRIENSILGSIQVHEDEVRTDPIRISISDSILDSTSQEGEAIGAPGLPVAHIILSIKRTTVFGKVLVHAIELAENSIFTDCLCVARRQFGCMRFCYVPPHCRTPRRYHCQPDWAMQLTEEKLKKDKSGISMEEIDIAKSLERERVKPQFNSMRYGRQDYAQLTNSCADEIKCGADDESEMGAFHNLYNPQREANLRARLNEFTPAGMEAGIIIVT